MKAQTIACRECTAPYETVRSNTKFCSRCRLLKDLQFLGPKVKKCWICEDDYAPLDHKDPACGKHSYTSERSGVSECLYCHETKPQVRKDVPICHECARDPKLRPRVISSLLKGQTRRREEAVV